VCGIAGIHYFDPRRTVDESTVRRMVESINHRGPDDDGYLFAAGTGIGMRRLSIIDIAGGKQPLGNEDGGVRVFQNGEIYNYIELAAELRARGHRIATWSDTEVIAHLYEDEAEAFPRRLSGMFAIALLDIARRRLVLARDRFGKKPLFLYQDDEKLVFASEIKAILVSGLVRTKVDPAAVYDYLSYNFVPLPQTVFEGIRHVPPASVLMFDDRRATEHRYWKLDLSQGGPFDDDLERRFIEEFQRSVEFRLRADVPVAVFLSGGVDSSSVAWAASRASTKPVIAFNVSFDLPEYDEASSAKAVADSLGLPLRLLRADETSLSDFGTVMWHCDQPHGDASFLPMLKLARAAQKEVKVVLTGEGADEVLGGYAWHVAAPYNSHDAWPEVMARFDANAVFGEEEKRAICRRELAAGFAPSALLVRDVLETVPTADPITQTLVVDLALLLPGNNLVKADRMGMACGVELRCPFLDHRFVELAFTIRGSDKIRGGQGKLPLRTMIASELPSAAWRAKRIFGVPMREWLRGEGGRLLDAMLNDPTPLLERWFDRDVLRALIVEHRSGADRTRKLRALVALDVWYRTFAGRLTNLER
jgi:asparagine synthase (glutamine-hydrolysing)